MNKIVSKTLLKRPIYYISLMRKFLFLNLMISLFLIFILCFVDPGIFQNIFAQQYRMIHPYRQLDIGTSLSDGYAVKGNIMYLATLFDGHIYEFNLTTRTMKDRFRIHPEDKNQNSPGAMIYVKENNTLYAGTNKSFTRLPFIYLFDPDGEDLPKKIIHIDTLNIYSFFNPIQIDDHIYWGCYHTHRNGIPKIIKMDIYNNQWQVKEFRPAELPLHSNYTFSLENIRNILYVSTESGHILKYDTRINQFLTSTIDLSPYGAAYIPHLATDGKGLWVMTTIPQRPLFYIEKPEAIQPKIYQISERTPISFSRIFFSKIDSFLYGQGYRIKYLKKGRFNYEAMPYLNYENLRDILGIYTLSGRNYILGENNHIKDVDVSRREFRIAQLPPRSVPEIVNIPDIKSEKSGAILLTMSSDKVNKLYLSTYLIGFLYAIDGSMEKAPTFLTDNRHVRFNEQADIILAYPAIRGSILLGCYKGSSGSAVLYFFNPSETRGQQWIMGSLPEKQGVFYPRITALAFDSLNNIYIGTGEMTISATTVPAAIFFVNHSTLQRKRNFPIQKEIDYRWPEDSEVNKPVRIMAMAQAGNYLYCISYHSVENGIKNKFFRVDLKNGRVEISKYHEGAFVGIRNKLFVKEENYLIVAFDSCLYKYDVNRFTFEMPVERLNLEKSIKTLVGDDHFYYLGTDQKIMVIDKQFRIIQSFYPPSESDTINDIDILGGMLYAITKNGWLIKYNISDQKPDSW